MGFRFETILKLNKNKDVVEAKPVYKAFSVVKQNKTFVNKCQICQTPNRPTKN